MRVDLLLVFISLSLSSSSSDPTPHGLSHLIPLCGLFLLRTSAIQASLIALGLASVLLFPMLLLFLLLVLIAANLLFGSVSLPMSEVIAALMGYEAPEAVRIIVYESRRCSTPCRFILELP